MTNYDKIKELQGAENLGRWMCKKWEESVMRENGDEVWCCDCCPVTDKCSKKKNGFVAWLEEECDGE